MMEIADFLLARIADDEAKARAALRESSYEWSDNAFTEAVELAEGEGAVKEATEHIARWDPARVLAECEAKRRIVADYQDERSRRDVYQRNDAMAVEDEKQRTSRRSSAARTRGLEIALEALALPYADHPDYRDDWKS